MNPRLATFGSIQNNPGYTGGQLMENTWRYENWTVHNHLCKCVILIAGTDGQIGKQVHGQSMDRDFEPQ
jgi:hypothetical protein